MRMAGTTGKCRSQYGRPLFVYMKCASHCGGSKIDHLLGGGLANLSGWRNYDVFLHVLKRLLRDGPMDGDLFKKTVRSASRRYNIMITGPAHSAHFYNTAFAIIGHAKLEDDEIVFAHDYKVARMRDSEFESPKYKKMGAEQVEFLKAVYELATYSKKLLKEQKEELRTQRYLS